MHKHIQKHIAHAKKTYRDTIVAMKSFTIIELLIVLVILGILFAALFIKFRRYEEAAHKRRAVSDLRTLVTAMEMYLADNGGQFPPDANRNIPVGLESYIDGYYSGTWPKAPRPNSIYDRDAWKASQLTHAPFEDVYQISIRFCPAGGPLSACSFPKEKRAAGFNINSAVYLCLKGPCRSHRTESYTYPGFCMNCQGSEGIQ